MGISVQSSGIAVEKSKFYLVNLNAEPSMNELLVYYLKVRGVFRVYVIKTVSRCLHSVVQLSRFG